MPEKQRSAVSWMLATLLLCFVAFSSASEHASVEVVLPEFANGSGPLLETLPGNADAILPRERLLSLAQTNTQLQPRTASATVDFFGTSASFDALLPAAFSVSQSVLFSSYAAEFYFVALSLFSQPYAPRSPPAIL